MLRKIHSPNPQALEEFLNGESTLTIDLFEYFIKEYRKIAEVQIIPAKTMIGIATDRKRIS